MKGGALLFSQWHGMAVTSGTHDARSERSEITLKRRKRAPLCLSLPLSTRRCGNMLFVAYGVGRSARVTTEGGGCLMRHLMSTEHRPDDAKAPSQVAMPHPQTYLHPLFRKSTAALFELLILVVK